MNWFVNAQTIINSIKRGIENLRRSIGSYTHRNANNDVGRFPYNQKTIVAPPDNTNVQPDFQNRAYGGNNPKNFEPSTSQQWKQAATPSVWGKAAKSLTGSMIDQGIKTHHANADELFPQQGGGAAFLSSHNTPITPPSKNTPPLVPPSRTTPSSTPSSGASTMSLGDIAKGIQRARSEAERLKSKVANYSTRNQTPPITRTQAPPPTGATPTNPPTSRNVGGSGTPAISGGAINAMRNIQQGGVTPPISPSLTRVPLSAVLSKLGSNAASVRGYRGLPEGRSLSARPKRRKPVLGV